jgi:hypothetical protein
MRADSCQTLKSGGLLLEVVDALRGCVVVFAGSIAGEADGDAIIDADGGEASCDDEERSRWSFDDCMILTYTSCARGGFQKYLLSLFCQVTQIVQENKRNTSFLVACFHRGCIINEVAYHLPASGPSRVQHLTVQCAIRTTRLTYPKAY